MEFIQDRTIIGNTEIIYYLTPEGAKNLTVNHAEQTGFKELKNVISIKGTDFNVYHIRLVWEKPAAALDPDWEYDETKVYVAMKELERSLGFNFSTVDVPEATIDKIIRSIRLNVM